MLTFLFWNLHRNSQIAPLLERVATLHRVDVAAFAECPFSPNDLIVALGVIEGKGFRSHEGRQNRRIIVAVREPVGCSDPVAESRYLTVRPLNLPGRPELLLAAMHGISLLEAEHIDLNEEAVIAAGLLRNAEENRGHNRTVLLGDFNLNPFDQGMAKASGFHAVMSRDVARDEYRRVRFNKYPTLYNPMWGRLGDLTPGPPGTYFFDKAQHLRYYWNTYDQAMIRPSLLAYFRPNGLEVLDRIGNTRLLTEGVPDPLIASDHLPVVLRLEL